MNLNDFTYESYEWLYISYSHSIPFSTIEATYWLRMRWLLEYFGNWVAVAGGVGENFFFLPSK